MEQKGMSDSLDQVESNDAQSFEKGEEIASLEKTSTDSQIKESDSQRSTEERISDCCNDMLEKVLSYLNGDLTATCEDYKLLEKLNGMTSSKYKEMSAKTMELTENMNSLNEKYRALQPFLEQIDHLEKGVQKLEVAANQLDAYSKQLEARFKKVERK